MERQSAQLLIQHAKPVLNIVVNRYIAPFFVDLK